MYQFSKLVSSAPINLRILTNNISSCTRISDHCQKTLNPKRNYCNSQKRKLKKNRTKQKKVQVDDAKSNFLTSNLNHSSSMNGKNSFCSFRKWTNEDNVNSLNEPKFMVMSYNILAQDLLETHSYLYNKHFQLNLDWKIRLSNLANEIRRLRPNILCLQEVQQDHLCMILKSLEDLQFDYIFKKKTGIRTDGCAILYDKNKFNLNKKHTVEYHQSVEHLDRENIALAAELQFKEHELTAFLVVTTHLLYNPRRQDVRLAQIQLLLAEIDKFSFNGYSNRREVKRIPIILTGDFNFKPYSAPYNLIHNGHLQYNYLTKNTLELCNENRTGNFFLSQNLGITDTCQHIDLILNNYQGESRLKNSDLCTSEQNKDQIDIKQYLHLFSTGYLSHSLNLKSVYKHICNDGLQAGSTYQEEWITVDYLFYSKNIYPMTRFERKLKLISCYTLPSVKDCSEIGRIPNKQFGSDHLALAAEFTFS